MLQSIGVIIASVLIYIWPETKTADPICTYLFSILVIITTIPVFKDCMTILMESKPKGVQPEKIKNQIMSVKGVKAVTDFHVWALAGNKNILTAHILIEEPMDSEIKRVHEEVMTLLSHQDLCHITLQIL